MNKTLLSLLFPVCITACSHERQIQSTDEYTHEIYCPKYASGFRILSLPADSTSLALEIYRPDTMKIAIPDGGFQAILCMSSTYVGGLSCLGVDSLIVAVSGREYLSDSIVRNRAVEVGFEGALNYEAILSSKPDIALIYGIGGRTPIEPKLQELQIPYIYINDFEEQNPLGRAEWIVALGALTQTDGQQLFNEITNQYRPVDGNVPLMINAPYSGAWFIPGRDNYMSKLIEDAGGKIIVEQTDGASSSTVDLEEALPALKKAKIWLNPGQVNNLTEAKQLVPKAVFNAEVWNQTGDFYESGASRPDLVLQELQKILGGCASDSMKYFINLK